MNRIRTVARRLTTSNAHAASSSINAEEVFKFSAASAEWWDPRGQFGMLHQMNPPRMNYIRNQVLQHISPTLLETNMSLALPFKGLRILDAGCGGGLLSESLARLGAQVTGLDASPENTAMATYHASLDPSLSGKINYLASTVESLVQEKHEPFDVVCSLEVIEHVNNPKQFIIDCLNLVKPGGVAVFSTINRTKTSHLFTILLAEHVLRWVPVGTHDHSKYITPSELESFVKAAENNGQDSIFSVVDISGIEYRVLENRWVVKTESNAFGDLDMNYLMSVKKETRVIV